MLKCVHVGSLSLGMRYGDSIFIDSIATNVLDITCKAGLEAGLLSESDCSMLKDYVSSRECAVNCSISSFLSSVKSIPALVCYDPGRELLFMNFYPGLKLWPLSPAVCPIPAVECAAFMPQEPYILALAYLVERGEEFASGVSDITLSSRVRGVIEELSRVYSGVARFLLSGLEPPSLDVNLLRSLASNEIPISPWGMPSMEIDLSKALQELGLPSLEEHIKKWKLWERREGDGEVAVYAIDSTYIPRITEHSRVAGWIVITHRYPSTHRAGVYEFTGEEYFNIAKKLAEKHRDARILERILWYVKLLDKPHPPGIVGLTWEKLERFLDLLGDLLEQAINRGAALGKLKLSDWEDLYVLMIDPSPTHEDVAIIYEPRLDEELLDLDKM